MTALTAAEQAHYRKIRAALPDDAAVYLVRANDHTVTAGELRESEQGRITWSPVATVTERNPDTC